MCFIFPYFWCLLVRVCVCVFLCTCKDKSWHEAGVVGTFYLVHPMEKHHLCVRFRIKV